MKISFTPKFLILLFCFLSSAAFAQTGTISGTISSDKNELLTGATVKIKGTQLGAMADVDGNFSISNVPAGKQILQLSYIGYQAKDVTVVVKENETSSIKTKLTEDSKLMNEVVVVGYGTQVKKDLTSSVVTVKSKDIADKPVYNFTSALQGKASGVQVTTDNGLAGATTSIRIRGTKTLSNTAEPLYVVDGIPVISNDISDAGNRVGYNTSVLSTINPNDIESIEILKDAAATAIYGARGANGVVIVTTKSGKAGKTKIDVSYNGGISQAAHKIKLLNGPQYLELYKEAYHNDGGVGNPPLPQNLDYANVANTNWIDQVLRTGYYNEASLSASGGSEKTNFFIGAGLRDEKPFSKGNSFQRISLRANVNHIASKHFDCGTSVGVTYTDNKYVPNAWAGGLGAAQSYMLPIYPVRDTAGNYFLGSGNPLAQIDLIKNDGKTWRVLSSTYASIHFAKYFTLRNEFGIDLVNQHEEFYKPRAITGDSAVAEDRRIQYFTWNYTPTLSYHQNFKEKHDFEILVGVNPTRTEEKFSYISAKGFSVTSQTQVQGAGQVTYATAGTGREYSFMSYFARVNYKILGRYLFQLSFRADGSSRFSPSKRYGYFPSGSVAWIISEEKFLKNNAVLNFLKLRASAGTSGNAEFTDDFAYFSAFSSGQNYGGSSGIGPANTSVPNLTWETTMKTNVAVDFGLWKDRLSGTIEYYYERTFNMLVQGSPLTPSSGFSSVTRNLGSLRNTGMEVQLTSNNLGTYSPVKWKTQFNIAFNQNKILNLGNVQSVSGTNYGDNRAIVGYSVGTWVLAEYAGVDPATGAPLIYDSLGNKIIADATSTVKYRKPAGNPYPKFFGGISNTFEWKGIELEILLTYSYGNKIYDDHGKRQLGNLAFGWNQDVRALDRWQNPGDVTNVPKASLNSNYDFNTTRNLYDASYLRLRTITLAYNLPEKATNKMKIRSWRIFVSAQNLAVATKYKGWDPEVNRERSGAITQGVNYLSPPQARVISFGINVGL